VPTTLCVPESPLGGIPIWLTELVCGRYDHREQRDLRRTATEGDILDADASGFINKLSSPTPAPEFAAEFVELCGELFENLDDPQLRQIGWLKIEGYNDQEIADQLGCARRTVQRKVERIRRAWQQSQGIVD
jgi:DNA-directed RNA polymerase specialized sigma24 family protein